MTSPKVATTFGASEVGQRPPYIEPQGSGKLSHPGSPIVSQAGSPILSHPGAAIESHPGQRDRIPASFSPSLAILREHTTLQEGTSGGAEGSGDRPPCGFSPASAGRARPPAASGPRHQFPPPCPFPP